MNRRKLIVLVFSLLIGFPHQAFAQQSAPKNFELTVDNIMRGYELTGYAPTGVYWSQDSQRVYFRWKRAGDPRLKDFDLYVVNRDGSGLHKLSEEEARLAPPASGELSRDKTLTVFTEEGDVWLYDHRKNERRQITKTTDSESNAHFTADQKRIYFTQQNNLYVMPLDGNFLSQITDIRPGGGAAAAATPAFGGARQSGSDQTQQKGTDSQEFIKKEERELLEAVRERALDREAREAKRRKKETRKSFNVPAGQMVSNLSLSPDEKYVMASVLEPARGAKTTIVPNYITESAYTEDLRARNKVGDEQGQARLAIITAETGEVKYVEHGLKSEAKASSGTQESTPPDAQQPRRGSQNQAQTKQHEREVRLFMPVWSEDGKHAVLLARSADNKDRWIMSLDPATAKTKVLFHDHDNAWIGGPGSFTLGWLPDNSRIYFQSERDGFAHLYTMGLDGGEPQQLTSGRWEVTDVEIAPDKARFYLTTSEVSSGERQVYAMSFAGGERVRLTTMAGNNQATVSPDQSTLAVVYSYSNKPPELYLIPNKSGTSEAEAKQITTSPTDEWRAYNWIDPPIVQFKARDGAMIPARIYKPKNYQRGGPAVLFVHGAGYLQNVHKWWSSYFREYMFHHLLMERGYLVLDVDYRASAGYGRDWRTSIYRHMGGQDLTDQVDAVKYLIAEHGIDPKRVGIYGGSYGGFITLMAMFTEPDVFAAGAALRPVTDWAHYNHPYTSNILNTPQSDAEAYRRSSPIYHAQGLKGALLICHGMVDVNVHFQDSVRLAQRLIELRKENWELAVYPVEDHGFEQPTSWADEYRRILKLFENNLKSAAEPKPRKAKAKR